MPNGSLENSSQHQNSVLESATSLPLINKHEDAPQGHEGGSPTKKRKLADTTPSITLPRPVSPPWKRISVEGPTSFVQNGRRKSSRTNAVPLELQPQSATRRTRAAAGYQVEGNKGRPARHSYSNPLTQVKNEKGAERKTMSAVKSSQSGPGRPPISRESLRSPSSLRQSHVKVDPLSFTQSKNTPTKHVPDVMDEINPRQKHLVRKNRSPKVPRPRPRTPIANWSEVPISLNRRMLPETYDGLDEPIEPRSAETLPKSRLQKIKFTVRMPSIVVQSPANIPKPKNYASFLEFLEKDELEPTAGEGVLSSLRATEEARARKKVAVAKRFGGKFDKELKQVLPERSKEPDQQYFHRDHLLAHALHFKKLLQAEHQKHRANAKKIALEAFRRVRASIPKSREEMEQEQIDLEITKYRQVIKDLSRLWNAVEADVASIRQSEVDAIEQARKIREFHEQVEKHTQMLAPTANAKAFDVEGSDDDQSLDPADDRDDISNSGSEDNMSSSDTASEADVNAEDVDAVLTAEQLHEKYATLPILPTATTGTDRLDDMIMEFPTPEAASKESLVLETVDDVLLDDDSESIATDDGEDSDVEGSTESDGGEETDQSDQEPATLRSLFGPKDLGNTIDMVSVSSIEQIENEEKDDRVDTAPRRSGIDTAMLDTVTQIEHSNSATIVETAATKSNPTLEMLIEDNHSIEPSTPASPHTSVTKASDEDSFTSSDARADSQRPVTPLRSKGPRVKTPVPSLLRGTLREYQHEGLDWLANLYANHRNGILADEMGLGKTIQSIAVLAHLAVEHHIWGPHLIVVPSSVLLNWEMEFKKFAPGFKVLTYYGNPLDRKQKRKGWTDTDLWHVVITTYQLLLQDSKNFKRRSWHYMILDEAHNIKNFRSQRWQTMLTFKTRARLLLTGTPLQNNLTELWSLLFFLRPTDMAEDEDEAFAGLSDFSDWFRKPVDQILDQGRDTMDDEARDQVAKLHKVIRPYLLRRLKADVEKQMPLKYEHVELCRLSKRQRQLYDGFMSMTKTKETLASGNYLSIINCLMQLRKVCNHPDLFETRPVTTSYTMLKPVLAEFEVNDFLVRRKLLAFWDEEANFDFLRLSPVSNESRSTLEALESSKLLARTRIEALRAQQRQRVAISRQYPRNSISGALASLEHVGRQNRMAELEHDVYDQSFHLREKPVYGKGLLSRLSIATAGSALSASSNENRLPRVSESALPSAKLDLIKSTLRRAASMQPLIQRFGCVTPTVVAPDLASKFLTEDGTIAIRQTCGMSSRDPFHEARTRLSIAFPDKRLLQYDCGKLQRLDKLLRELQAGGHRALIFTQMTKVLDILEQFLNIHGHRYLRLDGATKIEQRQILTERFNNDTQFLAFILSSRSGGLGINLTGADTVIFYDLDWNPAMDKQCQDRCHRIGQTRDVHIYRFVSEHTIESNILRKSNQKRMLDDVVIQEGDFTTDYFNKLSVRDMLGEEVGGVDADAHAALDKVLGSTKGGLGAVLETAEDKEDADAAKFVEREDRHADDGDFEEKVVSNESNATPKTSAAQTPREDGSADPAAMTARRAPYLSRAIRDLDEWLLESMIEWKNQELGEIRPETVASASRDQRSKKKRASEHRIKRAK